MLAALIFVFITFGIIVSQLTLWLKDKLGIFISTILSLGLLLTFVFVHGHGMFRYVIPYYYSDTLFEPVAEVTLLPLNKTHLFSDDNDLDVTQNEQKILIESIGNDPWLQIDTRVHGDSKVNYLEIDYRGDTYNVFKFYWSLNEYDYNEALYKQYALKQISHTLGIRVPSNAHALRLDFGESSASRFRLFSFKSGEVKDKYPLIQYVLDYLDIKLGLNKVK